MDSKGIGFAVSSVLRIVTTSVVDARGVEEESAFFGCSTQRDEICTCDAESCCMFVSMAVVESEEGLSLVFI
jgi:hypothetical protein